MVVGGTSRFLVHYSSVRHAMSNEINESRGPIRKSKHLGPLPLVIHLFMLHTSGRKRRKVDTFQPSAECSVVVLHEARQCNTEKNG